MNIVKIGSWRVEDDFVTEIWSPDVLHCRLFNAWKVTDKGLATGKKQSIKVDGVSQTHKVKI